MFKILVTGATGFIGSHVMKYLGGLGYELDTLSSTEFMAEDWGRLDNFRLEGGDKPTHVVHCAWTRKKDLHSNEHMEFAEHTTNFFDECANRGVKVINLGSSSDGTYVGGDPVTSYGIAKLAVTLYAKKLGFNTLRLFTVYGSGGTFDPDKPWEKMGNPDNLRDFVDVHTVCIAIERLLHARHLYGEAIDIGEGQSHTVGRWWNDNSVFLPGYNYPQRQYEPVWRAADTKKAKELLNL